MPLSATAAHPPPPAAAALIAKRVAEHRRKIATARAQPLAARRCSGAARCPSTRLGRVPTHLLRDPDRHRAARVHAVRERADRACRENYRRFLWLDSHRALRLPRHAGAAARAEERLMGARRTCARGRCCASAIGYLVRLAAVGAVARPLVPRRRRAHARLGQSRRDERLSLARSRRSGSRRCCSTC